MTALAAPAGTDAPFVALKVLTSSVITEIAEGFLRLMGVSNRVYITPNSWRAGARPRVEEPLISTARPSVP